MNQRQFLQAATMAAVAPAVGKAQGVPEQRQWWVELAEALKPRLHQATRTPVRLVRPVADGRSFLRWRMEREAPAGAGPPRVSPAPAW